MFEPAQLPYTAAAAVFMSLQPILVSFSKNAAGGFDYSVPASTMLSEILKLLISAVLLARQRMQERLQLCHDQALSEFITYMLPALIYFVNNNCLFFILQAQPSSPRPQQRLRPTRACADARWRGRRSTLQHSSCSHR